MLSLLLSILPSFSVITTVIWFYILPCPRSILKVGRSKNGYRKLMKSMSFKDKFFMKNFIGLSKTAKRLQRFFIVWSYIFYISVVVFVTLVILFCNSPLFSSYLRYYMTIKMVFIELPGIFVAIPNMYHSEKGGLDWKFLNDNKRKRG